jgi:thymidylate synthase (FAD)
MLDGYNVEVKLLALTGLVEKFNTNEDQNIPDSEKLIEYAGRLCWDSVDKLGNDIDRINEWIKMGHESVIEHASATFYIRASRVFTHELVRHRIASYSQRSQRHVNESELKYIMPDEINTGNNDKVRDIFAKSMENSWKIYRELLELGIKKEIARYVLPNACETQIVVTMNFRELRHFIELRTSDKALPEMRAIAGEIQRIMLGVAPQVFSNY